MRNRSIDIMKGGITLLMISCHLLYQTIDRTGLFNEYVNLTTFSGFLFCFGFVTYSAYFSRYEKPPIKKLIIGFVKTLIAYYASAFMLIFMLTEDHSLTTLIDFLIQKRIASYAEFLLSWSYMYIIILVLFNLIKRVIDDKYLMVIAIIVSLICTFIPYDQLTIPWIGPLLGMGHLDYFPLVQYSSYFLVGLYISKNRICQNKTFFVLAIVSHLIFLDYLYKNGHFPTRWGVDIYWIIGGYLYIYLYYIIANMAGDNKVVYIIEFIGKNTLLFLVCSNFFVFIGSKFNFVSMSINKFVFYLAYWVITVGVCLLIACLKTNLKIILKTKNVDLK